MQPKQPLILKRMQPKQLDATETDVNSKTKAAETAAWDNHKMFAGPCAQGVLDPIIVPRPMPLGCAGLIDPIVQFKDNAFLRTSAHESVPLAGYLPFLVADRELI